MNRFVWTAMCAAAIGCSTPPADAPTPVDEDAPADRNPPVSGSAKADSAYAIPDEPLVLPAVGTDVLAVTQARVLMGLEQRGFDLASLFTLGADGTRTFVEHNQLLAEKSSWYGDIAAHVEDALDELQANGRYTYRAEAYVNRLFNKGWLRSPWARFELVAVVPRIDRLDFEFDGATCGEVRFLYRLAYHKTNVSDRLYSRMPFAFNLVYDVLRPANAGAGHAGCVDIAKRLRVDAPIADQSAYVDWLVERFDVADSGRFAFKQAELNLQAVRIPSEAKDDLGGHAEYLMRIFRPDPGDGTRMQPTWLENTPNVDALAADPDRKAALLEFLKANLDAIDRGVVQVPQTFLARAAKSFSTHGLNRLINKPYTRLFTPEDFADIDFSGTRLVKTPQALLTRLDDMTCTGCHQSNSVAGFHMLGLDRLWMTHPLNALRVSGSAHFHNEIDRRADYVSALIDGSTPEVWRPLSFQRHDDLPAPAGGRCYTDDDAAKHFHLSAKCAEGLSCKVLEVSADGPGPDVGTCVRPATKPVAGDPCWVGTMTDDGDPRKDHLSRRRFGCQGYGCLKPEEGTPAGLCIARCVGARGDQPRNDDEICAYNGGSSFDRCATTGDWSSCIIRSTRRGLRTACDEQNPCRDDYICQRFFLFEDGAVKIPDETRGYCVPNYFLYQLRLDGHPHDPLN